MKHPRRSNSAILRSVADFLNRGNARTAEEPATLPEVLEALRSSSIQFSYVALQHFLKVAHEELDRNPSTALNLTRSILRQACDVYLPADGSLLGLRFAGLVWKEYANALYATGHLRRAFRAARRAVNILSGDGRLSVERADALLVQVLAAHRLERTENAKTWLHECRTVYEAARESRGLLHVQMIEAQIFYDAEQYEEARRAYLLALSVAEDPQNKARLLNNIGQCAVRLKEVAEAITYLTAAREALDREGMTAACESPFWGIARLLRDQGDLHEAETELMRVRHECLARGRVIAAAEAGLDLVELLAARGDSGRAMRVARELVVVFSNAGMPRNLRKALAYLTEQTARVQDAPDEFREEVRHIRTFLRQVAAKTSMAFRKPATR